MGGPDHPRGAAVGRPCADRALAARGKRAYYAGETAGFGGVTRLRPPRLPSRATRSIPRRSQAILKYASHCPPRFTAARVLEPIRFGLPQLGKDRPHVPRQRLRLLHRGEMAAARKFGPAANVGE